MDEKIRHAIISSQEGGVSRAKATSRQFGEDEEHRYRGRRVVIDYCMKARRSQCGEGQFR